LPVDDFNMMASSGPFDIKSSIEELQSENNTWSMPTLTLELRREFALDDALRHFGKYKFNPHDLLKVIFVGEAGEDTRGLRREFWRLFMLAAAKQYFIGSDNMKTFVCDSLTLKDGVYLKVGQ
jgi:hypothetical protein